MTDRLRACPFCGAPGYLMLAAYGFKIKCTDTDCTVETPIKTHKHQVESLWNRRASQDKEQRAGFVMVPPKDSEQLRLAVRAVKQTLFSGGSSVALPADSWIERAFIAGMLAAAPPIEALEGGKTDLGASGPVHQDTSSTPASASELRNLVAALRKLGEPVYAIGGELPLGSDQLIALDAANAIERLSSKAGGSQA